MNLLAGLMRDTIGECASLCVSWLLENCCDVCFEYFLFRGGCGGCVLRVQDFRESRFCTVMERMQEKSCLRKKTQKMIRITNNWLHWLVDVCLEPSPLLVLRQRKRTQVNAGAHGSFWQQESLLLVTAEAVHGNTVVVRRGMS